MPFVPLHAQSDGSLLGGASSVRSLIDEAVRCGYDTLALADENSLITAVPFFEEAHRQGIRPILGTTLDDGESRIVALVDSELGHTHLCRLISRLNLGLVPPEGETGTLPEALAAGSGGLHLLVSSPRTAARLLDVFQCPRCSSRIQRISWITEFEAIRRILVSVGLTADSPHPAIPGLAGSLPDQGRAA